MNINEPRKKYRLWNYIKDELVNEDRTISPFYINFRDNAALKQKLHRRIYMVGGMVVQIIHYVKYDLNTNTYSIPIIKEVWKWTYDNNSDTVISREIIIQGYSDEEKDILVPTKFWFMKYYVSEIDKLKEIRRRRYNIIYDLKDKLIKKSFMCMEEKNTIMLIIEVDQFIQELQNEIDRFINLGCSDDLTNRLLLDEKLQEKYRWLNKNMELFGYGYGKIIDLIIRSINVPTKRVLSEFDYSTI